MGKTISTILLALSLFIVTYAVNLQAPLYGAYAFESGAGAGAVTFAFAAYVAGLMPTLVFLGGLSDRIGRRLPLVLALILGLVATCLLSFIPSWESLVFARILLGIGTGLATPAGTAYMTEILGAENQKKAALIVTSTTSLGFGGGALATGVSLSVQGFSFTPSSFIALFVLAPVLALTAFFLARADKPEKVSLLRLPVFPENSWIFGMALCIAWATTGMTIAVIPLELKNHNLEAWTGFVIFLAIFIGFLCQPVARKFSNAHALIIGFVLIPLGYSILLVGFWVQSIILVLVGTGITSASSYGFIYLAALAEVSARAPLNRARAVAGLFIYAYVGFSLPVIGSGVLADMIGLLPALIVFGIVQFIMTLLTSWAWAMQTNRLKSAPSPIM